jgi:tetratricopeptide (TPR) repeat protein
MSERALRLCVSLFLAAGVLAVFLPATGYDFVSYDDWKHVRDNPALRDGLGLAGLRRAFGPDFYHLNWIPLTSLSFLVDHALFGLDPAGYHATNVALHAAASVLLFHALRRLSGALWPSALAAGLFAVHPLQVESVAWISSRKDVLAGVFFAATLLAYARYAEHSTPGRFAWVLLGTVAALLAKPTTVALPPLLLLLDLWPLRRFGSVRLGRLLGEKAILMVPVAAVSAVVLQVQTPVWQGGHPFDVRLANALDSCVQYLRASTVPTGLAAFYPHPGAGLSAVRIGGAAFAVTLATAAALGAVRRRPYGTVGWLWFLGFLVPVLGLIEVGLQARADRYMYLPIIGLAVIVAWGIEEAARRWPRTRAAWVLAAVAGVVALSIGARSQLEHWRDSASLYARALAVTRGNYVAHYGLAGVLAGEGDLDGARAQLLEAIRFAPRWPLPYQRLAELESARGEPGRAADVYGALVAARPHDPELHVLCADALLRAGHPRTAIEHYRAAVDLGWPPAAERLAWLLATHPEPGLRDPEQALRLAGEVSSATPAPGASLLDTLAAAQAAAGDFSGAARRAEDAVERAEAAGETLLAAAIRERLALYRAGRPFVQPPPAAPKTAAQGIGTPW